MAIREASPLGHYATPPAGGDHRSPWACRAWLGSRQEWRFALTVSFAAVVWLVVVWLLRWVAP
jgi:hypothetical protein